ncbi:MAG: DUF4301 family protein [Bacteroidales bacterium]|nr:DUF4301 family protein [Bacteroidales bacterium]
MFSSKDLIQLSARGITREAAEQQMVYFRTGFPPLKIDRAATVEDGIRRLSAGEVQAFGAVFDEKRKSRKLLKFVPASGAATRMFKDLYEFLSSGRESAPVREVFDRLSEFAFYSVLKPLLSRDGDRMRTAETILLAGGLNYGSLPKGMLLFHAYPDGEVRTVIEEHLAEGAEYACCGDGEVHLHFTVSSEHQAGFEALVREKVGKYAERYGVNYHVGFSQQKPSTDTIAAGKDNHPMRNGDGSLLFRPGGHGALLENLNEQYADLIFIKNIDNVVPDHLKSVTVTYKKALAGLLLHLQDTVFDYVRKLRSTPTLDGATTAEIRSFLSKELAFHVPADFEARSPEAQQAYLLQVLNRPIRVCGMVKNEGEPGGGPFWVNNADGSVSLQIAESSQIDMNDAGQRAIVAKSTHFNPVDLVCAVKDADGNPFNLLEYRDPDTGFISVKSKDGAEVKAQELPGLWNGTMARWNTVFAEVPVETFNPVKTLNDLLRPQHR